jgi:demethylmenaquinone methyltransferase/2-methoxy-6-polyprenyl-1,4-benzoquinol methylase
MSEFQMPDRDRKAGYVKENFSIIAKKYDRFNDLNSFYMHRLWKNNAVAEIKRSKKTVTGLCCLDLCCGTGDIALRLAKAGADVTAVDFCEDMLSIAGKKLHSFPDTVIASGDATDLREFPDGFFDAVTVGFGLRNVSNLDAAVSEINRVLKKGGIFVCLDVGKVDNRFIRFFADFYFFRIVPLIGYALWRGKNEMFNYLPESSLQYPDQKKLKEILENAGFIDVRYTNYVCGNAVMHRGVK